MDIDRYIIIYILNIRGVWKNTRNGNREYEERVQE